LQHGQYEHHHLHAAARSAPAADDDAHADTAAAAAADTDAADDDAADAAAPPPTPMQLRPRWPCLPAAPPVLLALLQPAAAVSAAVATPDGGCVACGCKDGSVVLYDLAAGQEVCSVRVRVRVRVRLRVRAPLCSTTAAGQNASPSSLALGPSPLSLNPRCTDALQGGRGILRGACGRGVAGRYHARHAGQG